MAFALKTGYSIKRRTNPLAGQKVAGVGLTFACREFSTRRPDVSRRHRAARFLTLSGRTRVGYQPTNRLSISAGPVWPAPMLDLFPVRIHAKRANA